MTRFTSAALGPVLLAGGLVISACHPVRGHALLFHHPAYTKVVSRLVCPDRQGELVRTDSAADGRACHYTDARGDQVDLSLLALNGASASQALLPTEAALEAALPSDAAAKASGDSKDGGDKDGGDKDDDNDNDKGDHDHTHIDLPGLHIDADGDKAHVRLPGVAVDADGDKAKVHTGISGFAHADIEANGGDAIIRAGASDQNGADMTYILASDTPGPEGVRAAGYIARGPAGGPLVVATFKSRRSDHGGRGDRDDISRLVNLNVR
jgi:hypothetical protein